MNNQNAQHLLEQVSVISKKYRDIAKITGENFNIFQILNLSTLEVSLHSKLIAELLNPNGSHEQGILFLKLFIDECGLSEFLLDAELEQTNVAIEVGVGKVDENYESGGRIDIVLTFNKGKSVLIENKINAHDQRNQLLRYQKAFSNAKIVYLNLWGEDEETEEVGGLNKSEFTWISYKDNVTNWLTKSLKEIYNKPNIVYILEHYLKTIKTITNQNNNSVMNKELINLLINSELNFNSANEIRVYLNQIDSLLMDFNALTNQWKKAISSEQRELTVFTQDEIEYKFRPTIEENIIVFQIFPEPFGSASGELHKLLLETIKKLYPQNSPNPNYICWIESKYNKQNLNFAQIKELIYNGNNDAWAYQIINEGIKILKDICASLPDKLQASNEVKRLFDKTNK